MPSRKFWLGISLALTVLWLTTSIVVKVVRSKARNEGECHQKWNMEHGTGDMEHET
ncbi:MAG: hypothetical protein N2381_06400 [Armatimonadetes bacterium]|nr:hypothetical protein [Armatimonadota bacterium]